MRLILILLFALPFCSRAQDSITISSETADSIGLIDSLDVYVDSLPIPPRDAMSSEYEIIILDGDTVLRSTLTQQIIPRNLNAIITTDWMNTDWNTTTFNPYKNPKVSWPIDISFENETLSMPLDMDKMVVTSRYGWRRGRAHKGIDLDLVTGDNVKAIFDGKVRFARYFSGFGNVIVVRHNNGLETVYGHLSKILVKPNTYVYSGQVIGKGGNTGRSRGSHLHLEIRYQHQAINPEYLIDFANQRLRAQRLYIDERWADPRKHRSYKQSNIQIRTFSPLQKQEPSLEDHFIKQSGEQTQSESGFIKPVEAQPLQKSAEYHVIVRGDTLGKIAKKYNTTVAALCELNGISKSSVLRVGKQLQVR